MRSVPVSVTSMTGIPASHAGVASGFLMTGHEVGAAEPYSEGIIDFLRAVEGTEIVALIREPPTQNGPTHRVSLRTRAEDVDVSAIARAASELESTSRRSCFISAPFPATR